MTPALSMFQSLPEHIVKKIISFSLTTYERDFERYPQSGLSLMHSCQRWREVFLRAVCSELTLDYSDEEFTFALGGSSYSLEMPQFPFTDYVKTVWLRYELLPYFYDKETVDSFLSSDYANRVFAAARRLEIEYADTTDKEPTGIFVETSQETLQALENLKEFLLRFKHNMPNVAGIGFEWGLDVSEKTDEKFIRAFDALVSEVTAGVKDVSLNNKRDPAAFLQVDNGAFSGLTRFQYSFFDEDPRGLEIIRRNSSTLQTFVADCMPGKAIDQMLYWDSGDPVVYSSLATLEFFYPTQQIVSDDDDCSCHFPALKKLDVYGANPMLSRAFFNGNKVLEWLRLWDTYDDAQGINSQQQFKSQSLGNLKYLALDYKYNPMIGPYVADPQAVDRYAELVDTLINAADCLSGFALKSSMREAKLASSLSTTAAFANIQKLEFTMIGMLFNDLVSVITNCPQLCTLRCSPINDYPSIDGMEDDGLVKHIEEKMYPLSRYLTNLALSYEDCWRDSETYMAMALLVVGCPRLSNISCELGNLYRLHDGLQDLACSSMFSNYRRCLEKIVPARY